MSELDYAELVAVRLDMRFMDITADEIREGLAIAATHGIEDDDAERSLWNFLERLTPYWEATHGRLDAEDVKPIRFVGWYALTHVMGVLLAATPTALRNEVLARSWGIDGVRFASAVAANPYRADQDGEQS